MAKYTLDDLVTAYMELGEFLTKLFVVGIVLFIVWWMLT